MTDTTRTMTNATNNAPLTITCAEKLRCTTVGSAPADCSSRAAARRSLSCIPSRPRRDLARVRCPSGKPARQPNPQRYVGDMAVLTDDQVDAALPDLPGWERADGALRRSIKFPAFLDGVDAVRRVAEKAEEADHHPDIDIRWRTVTFALVTHSEGGITENDLGMARKINEIVGNP
jgi:4a-hydroxytetrahydrobiopterin dehydratase